MKALKISLMILAALVLIGGAGYLYASSGIKSKPGYANMPAPSMGSENALLSVNVGPGGVRPLNWLVEQVAETAGHANAVPEKILKSALKELQGVQLRIYDSTGKREVFDSAIAQTAASLKQKNWETLMTVRDGEEHIVVLQYAHDKQIAGISIMASTPDKAFFLNLIGPFDVEAIAAAKRTRI